MAGHADRSTDKLCDRRVEQLLVEGIEESDIKGRPREINAYADSLSGDHCARIWVSIISIIPR